MEGIVRYFFFSVLMEQKRACHEYVLLLQIRTFVATTHFCREYALFGHFITQILLRQMQFYSRYPHQKRQVEPLPVNLVLFN